MALLEGAVLGGGFGLACVSDIAIAVEGAQFGLPETGLGVIPAQIAPFVVQRIGMTQARRLALTAARFNGSEAERLGLVHFSEANSESVDARLQQVLRNVLANAIRFAPAGSSIQVDWQAQPGGDHHISVRDHGPGIPPAELDTIFEAFVQLGNPGRERSQGLGLGLCGQL